MMPSADPHARVGLTNDERTMATLAHILGVFAGFLAPGIIYVLKRKESRFVAFHALQALVWHVMFFVCVFGAMIACMVTIVASGTRWAPATHAGPPPVIFFVMFPLIGLCALTNMALAIYMAVKAQAGLWTGYPLAGAIAKKIVGGEQPHPRDPSMRPG